MPVYFVLRTFECAWEDEYYLVQADSKDEAIHKVLKTLYEEGMEIAKKGGYVDSIPTLEEFMRTEKRSCAAERVRYVRLEKEVVYLTSLPELTEEDE